MRSTTNNGNYWQVLNQLSVQQLEKLNVGSSIQRGWVSLALYTQLYIGDTTSLHAAMNKWQYAYNNHPASFALPDNMQQIMHKFKVSGAWNLPVIKEGKYYGFISKSKMLTAYRNKLIQVSS